MDNQHKEGTSCPGKADKSAAKRSTRPQVRLMADEMDAFYAALATTGFAGNTSKAIKTAVYQFDKHSQIAAELKALQAQFDGLTRAVQSQAALLIALKGGPR